MADTETDEQRFVRELRRLLDEPDDVSLQDQKPQYRIRDDPSIAATRNLLRACQEAQGIGLRTVAVLESQGEQLDNVGRALDNLSADLDSAEGHLSQMRRPLFGLCPWRCRWKKKKAKKQDKAQPPPPRDQRTSETRKLRAKSTNEEEPAPEPTGSATARFSTTAGASSGAIAAEERGESGEASGQHHAVDETSQRRQRPSDADELSTTLTSLKGIAQEMGQQLSTQNEQVDELTARAASSEERIRQASQQADKILRDE
ncbi:synaptosomal-associated protein 25-A-like [Dermacentor albipictus]|uniref:synaptosomal-associated protein 25-A-like n=1 Tax=Dermacentor albipictus TaxID=60249 RepID=UPI0038FC1C85